MSKAKRIGTAAETAVVKYFQQLGVPDVTRKVLHGSGDIGDIHIGPVDIPYLVLEIKSRNKNCSYREIYGFMEELRREVVNTYGYFDSEKGYLILKIPGKGKVEDWMLYKFIDDEVWGCRVGDHTFKIGSGIYKFSDIDDIR